MQEALEHLTGLSGKVNVAFDSGTSTYTITFDSSLGNVTQLMGDGSTLTGTTAQLLPQDRPRRQRDPPRPDRERRRAEPQLPRDARPVRPLREGRLARASAARSASTSSTVDPHDGQLNLVGFGDGGVTSDLGSIGDFIGAASICFNPQVSGTSTCDNSTSRSRTPTLPLFIGTPSFQIPINDPILERPAGVQRTT